MAGRDISTDFAGFHARTKDIYNEHAAGYDACRSKVLFEQPWLDRFLEKLPANANVLDLGCGTGDPVDRYLLSNGCRITGLDCAAAMIDLARTNFPTGRWQQGDMRTLDLGKPFDGVLSWNGFFHLSRQEQTDAIPRIANHVSEGGALMLTTGHKDGEVTGTVEGATVYHSSLSIDAYHDLLRKTGFQTIEHVLEDPACNYHSVLLASNKRGDGASLARTVGSLLA